MHILGFNLKRYKRLLVVKSVLGGTEIRLDVELLAGFMTTHNFALRACHFDRTGGVGMLCLIFYLARTPCLLRGLTSSDNNIHTYPGLALWLVLPCIWEQRTLGKGGQMYRASGVSKLGRDFCTSQEGCKRKVTCPVTAQF